METFIFNGKRYHTYGTIPRIGDIAPCYMLVNQDLEEITCNDFIGKTVILNIFPSLDTDVCATSVRMFNKLATKLKDVVVICVSNDLPFAAKRFCVAENIKNVIVASAFRSPMFAQKYGLQIIDGPLTGLLLRSIIIIDEELKVIYTQLVTEITNEPDYDAAIKFISSSR